MGKRACLFFLGILVLIIFVVLNIDVKGKKYDDIKAVKGVMDLRKWNFEKNGEVNLNGQCEIYFKQLLKPMEIKNIKEKKYFNILGKLEEQLNNEYEGYMTLHLKILVPDNEKNYGLRINSMLTASKIWINGICQGGHGQVGKSKEKEKAIYLPTYSYFTTEDGVVDIVIWASNYRDLNPVIRQMCFGTKHQIMNMYTEKLSLDLFIIGVLFIVFLYNILLYIVRKKQKYFLFFAIMCLLMLLRCLILNERILVRAYPGMPYELLSKIAAISYYIFVPIYVFFLNDFLGGFSEKIKKLSFYYGSIFTIICLITNNEVYDPLGIMAQSVLFIIMIYILMFFKIKVNNKEKNAKISLAAFFIIVATTINDILVNNRVINNSYMVQLGMLIFVFLQSYVIAIDFSNRFALLEKLLEENKIMYEISTRDSLTQLYNRSYIDKVLIEALENFKDIGEIFSVLMLDVDYFKKINDAYGHVVGDEVLIKISKVLKETIGHNGHIGRYGGEEFIIVLPKTTKETAVKVGEKIRKNVESISFKHNDLKVTISIGIYENQKINKEECVELADNLLYLAKQNGRNRVEFS